jgi:hypothetical protein
VGAADCRLLDLVEAVDYARGWLERNRARA